MIGRTLGRYRITELLGAGGMGDVYRAHDERLDRDVAVKVLNASAFDDEHARSRFHREALALSRLNHPNIASLYDFEPLDGRDLLIMELVPGTSLHSRLTRGPLPEKEILSLGKQLMQGLAASHAVGIIHRDVKPGNIRITPDGRLKILDFGLAKEVCAQPGADQTTVPGTADGHIVGTPPYMAPEQLRGETLDVRTDVYGAGTVLYEMATGQRPFREESGPLLADQILNQPAVTPRALNARVSPALEQIILKMLEKDPDYRYQSAHEVAVDLDRLATGRVSTVAEAVAARPRRLPRARRRLVFGLSAGTIAAAAAVVLFLFLSNRPALSFAARDWILLVNVENITGDTVFDKSLDTAFRVSLEQSMYANVFSQSRVAETLKRMRKEKVESIDIPTGREICEREGIRGLVAPAVAQVGRQYSVTARLIDPVSGDTVRSYSQLANGKDEVLAAVDKVTGKLRRDLGESFQSMRQASVPLVQATTSSLDALKAHSDARALQASGDIRGAVRLFERALQLDPDFALAHAGAGGGYMSFVFNDKVRGREHLEKAMKLRNRATERERLTIELNYSGAFGGVEETMRLYRLYLASWPDDSRQRYNFAGLLRANNRLPEAIEQYREAIGIDPRHAGSRVNLALCYLLQNRYQESLASWDKAFELQPTWIADLASANLNHEYGVTLVAAGNRAKAREVYELAVKNKSMQPYGLRSQALLDVYEGKLRSAEARFQEAILLTKAATAWLSEARNHMLLGIASAAAGNRPAAVKELDAAFKLRQAGSPQAWLWARVAAAYASVGALPKAEALLAVVRAEASPDIVREVATLHWLEGELAMAKGRTREALEKMQLADQESRGDETQNGLARAYKAVGDRAGAIAAYEAMFSSRPCFSSDFTWACVSAKYDLAVLYRADGQPVKALKQVDELLALWDSADPNLPLLKGAKALQVELQRE